MYPNDKAVNKTEFICKKYYVQVHLKELVLLKITSSTYQQVNDTLHNVLQPKKILLILLLN